MRAGDSDEGTLAQRIIALAGLLALLMGIVVAMSMCGCSSGPQLPIVTTPISVSCTWNNMDGGASEDCDCMIDRSSAQAEGNPVGNVVRDVDVSPDVRTNVSATGGTGGGTP